MSQAQYQHVAWKSLWSLRGKNSRALPSWEAWFSLLFALTSLLASVRTELLIEWLLRSKVIHESATNSLPGLIVTLATVCSVIGIAGAWQVWLWGKDLMADSLLILAWGMDRWGPTRALLAFLEEAAIPVIARVRTSIGTAIVAVVGLLIATARVLRSGVHAFWVACGKGLSGARAFLLTLRGPLAVALKMLYVAVTLPIIYLFRAIAIFFHLLWLSVWPVIRFLWAKLFALASHIGLAALTFIGHLWRGMSAIFTFVWRVVSAELGYLWFGISKLYGYLWLGVSTVFRFLWCGVRLILGGLWFVVSAVTGILWLEATAVLGALRQGASFITGYLWLAVSTVFRYLWMALSTLLGYAWLGVSTFCRFLWSGVRTFFRYLWLALSTVFGYLWLGAFTVLRGLWLGISASLGYLWFVVTAAFGAIRWGASIAIRYLRLAISAVFNYVRLAISTILGYLWLGVSAFFGAIWSGVSAISGFLWLVVSTVIIRFVLLGVSTMGSYVWAAISTLSLLLARLLRQLWLGIRTIARHLWLSVSLIFGYLLVGASTVFGYLVMGISTILSYLLVGGSALISPVWSGACALLGYLRLSSSAIAGYLWMRTSAILADFWLGISSILGYLWKRFRAALSYYWSGIAGVLDDLRLPVSSLLHYLWHGVSAILGFLWVGVSTTFLYCGRGIMVVVGGIISGASTALGGLWLGISTLLYMAKNSPLFVFQMVRTACAAAPSVGRMALWMLRNRKGVPAMSDFDLTRERLLSVIGTLWLVGVVSIFGLFGWNAWGKPEPVVIVTQWSNGHLLRPTLLTDMAAQFNKANNRVQSGKRIEVKVNYYGSAEQMDDLVSRATKGLMINQNVPDPVIVSPSADHWLVFANNAAGRTLVDLNETESIARTWIGILTYRDMAECLGWPNKEIGYADIIALRSNPLGWASYPCAKAEWGQKPLLAYTDPATSSTGRSSLFTLYSIAAGKPAEELTPADVSDPKVVGFVKQFQSLVDHYMAGTIPLNTKVYLGPRYGHFFLMPEDDVVRLYLGGESAVIGGVQVKAPPISKPMVMIYPKEGSIEHNHSASFVRAPWVTDEQLEAAHKWVDFLHQDEQQRAFMASGFRPSGGIPLSDPISSRFGLDPTKPTVIVNPDRMDPDTAPAIVNAWDEVKKPGIVSFVVDVSGSMMGTKLDQAKAGLLSSIDTMSKNNRVGLVTFSDKIVDRVPVGLLPENRFTIANAIDKMRAQGNTDLYDAIKAGIEMVDDAPGDEDAIRGVVVLSDGQANRGDTELDDLIRMASRDEVAVRQFRGFEGDAQALLENGRQIDKKDVIGSALAANTRHSIFIFFIGIGSDADLQVGRMLAEATGAEFQGATEKDLASLIEQFGKYF